MKNLFNRFEFKYIVKNSLRNQLENELSPYLILDDFAEKLESKKYHVRSLYFDNKNYDCYHEKIDGLLNRRKFRIRTYSANKKIKSKIFLEIKGRYNNLVYKDRTPLNDDVKKLNGTYINDYLIQQLHKSDNKKMFNDFLTDHYIKKIYPVAIIHYDRRPYFSKLDFNFRITFDDNMQVSKSNALFPQFYEKKSFLPGYSIIEIKFETHIPSWFYAIIKFYNLKRISVSKICKGLESLNLTWDEG